MATQIPYLLSLNTVLTALGQNTMSYQVPPGQTLEIDEFVFVATGIFNLVGIRNGGSVLFSNISPSLPILSTMIADVANNFNVIKSFMPHLIIQGGDTFYIDVIDTSGAGNTVRFLGNCLKNLQ
jgi:hypothetical protein